jgi:hypothetical protein
MVANSNSFAPHPNFDSAINRAICQSEAEGGVSLNDLEVGAVLEVETGGHTYRIENRGEGKVLISGHPEYCPEPVLADLHGSTWGTGLIKMRFIGRGMRMEFEHPTSGLIWTSRVKAIREVSGTPEGETVGRKAS